MVNILVLMTLKSGMGVDNPIWPHPIDMVLHCPVCRNQHIDAPEPAVNWSNPPHRSHLCQVCGTRWRPADVPTNGVTGIWTRGQEDTWPEKK